MDAQLAVNHETFLVHFRNEEILRIASQRLPPSATHLYGCFLRALAPKIRSCNDHQQPSSMSLFEFMMKIPPDLQLRSDFARVSGTEMLKSPSTGRRSGDFLSSSARPRMSIDLDDEDYAPDREDENGNLVYLTFNENLGEDLHSRVKSVVAQHLKLISEDSLGFIEQLGSDELNHSQSASESLVMSNSVWRIDYEHLSKEVTRNVFERSVEQRFGLISRRLFAAIRKSGMIDEKQLSNRSLVRQQEVRTRLAQLLTHGIISLQEIPRSTERLPSKTFFCWFHNSDTAYRVMIEDLNRSILKLLEYLRISSSDGNGIFNLQDQDNHGKQDFFATIFRLNALVQIFRFF